MSQLIEHVIYGKGEVIERRYRGFELRVKFNNWLLRWVRREEVRFLTETPVLSKPEVLKRRIMPKEQYKARQMIEAFRLGIVPHEHVEEFTFGRDVEIEGIKNRLNQAKEGSQVLIGGYGSGKTHLLEHIYATALKNNWAVSLVELSANELPFYKPKRIYEAIINSFRFQKEGHQYDFREFMRSIARTEDSYKLEEHLYLGEIIRKLRSGEDKEYLWEWIEGYPSWGYLGGYPRMYDKATCANIYCYILSGIGWAARNIIGLDGFVILLDEAESVEPYWFSYYQNNKVWNFLKGFVSMTNNDERLRREVNENNFYKHKIYRGYWGHETKLQYCGYSRLPFLWENPSGVETIFAFVPHQVLDSREPLNTIPRIKIERIEEKFLREMLEKASLIYEQAYNTPINQELLPRIYELLPRDNIRIFIKAAVEAFDLLLFHPDMRVEELLR